LRGASLDELDEPTRLCHGTSAFVVRLAPRYREPTMSRKDLLERTASRYGLLAVYLFGSRADDGLALLEGRDVEAAGSDLDVGIAFLRGTRPTAAQIAELQVAFEDVFEPLRVDLVRLDRVDALFQFRAIDGHRLLATDSTAADEWELVVMRRAAELLPIQRWLERERFGVSTS
jgi:predicted nucleotidyltransferase